MLTHRLADSKSSYFKHFEGRQDCGIDSKDLYEAPPSHDEEADSKGIFCKNRASLLEAMTGGGRHGFDAPFKPKGIAAFLLFGLTALKIYPRLPVQMVYNR